jgi:hypothetical protein
MPAIIYESQLKITHGATVLVDYGDDLGGEPTLDGGQVVQLAGYVRGTAGVPIPRRNDTHTLRLPLPREAATIRAATGAMFSRIAAVPKTAATLTVELSAGGKWELANAVVQDWAGAVEDQFSVLELIIIGGAWTQVTAP